MASEIQGYGGTFTMAGIQSGITKITESSLSGVSREALETTHFGSTDAAGTQFGNRTYTPSKLVDPGEISFEINIDPQDLEQIMAAGPQSSTFKFSDNTTYTGSMFVTSCDVTMPNGELVTASVTVKLSGPITVGTQGA